MHLIQSQHWTYCGRKRKDPGVEAVRPSEHREALLALAKGTPDPDSEPICAACRKNWRKDPARSL